MPAMEEPHEIVASAEEQRKPVYDPTGRIEQVNVDEIKLADIRRHTFGLLVLYAQAIFGMILALGLVGILLPSALDTVGINRGAGASVFGLVSILAIFLVVIFLILSHRVYVSNQLIITSKNITQVLQVGLFQRKVSELSMGSIEDVTATQKGVFQTLLNYGTLTVETAGEQKNFSFIYCPNPNAYAKTLLDARSAYLEKHPE